MTNDCDVLIIGGALAGSAAGITLASRGRRVLILEKDRFPRGKVCGEFLSPGIWPLLDRLGLRSAVLEKGSPMDRVLIHYPGASLKLKLPPSLPGSPGAWGISRERLDSLFLDRAKAVGCEVREQHRVDSVRRKPEGFTVSASAPGEGPEKIFKADCLINAAGNNGFVEREENAGKNSDLFGFKAHFRGPSLGGAVQLFFFQGGYVGLGEIEDGMINLCGISTRSVIRGTAGRREAILQKASLENAKFKTWLKDAEPSGPWHMCGPLRHGNWNRGTSHGLAAGDAACFLEPFMGQGMTMAAAGGIVTGTFAADYDGASYEALSRRCNLELRRLYRQRLNLGAMPSLLIPGAPASKLLFRLSSFLLPVWQSAINAVCASPRLRDRDPVASSR